MEQAIFILSVSFFCFHFEPFIKKFQQNDPVSNFAAGLVIVLMNQARLENSEEAERRAVDRSRARARGTSNRLAGGSEQ